MYDVKYKNSSIWDKQDNTIAINKPTNSNIRKMAKFKLKKKMTKAATHWHTQTQNNSALFQVKVQEDNEI